MNSTEFKKLKQSFRYWVLGKAENEPEYYKVLKALEIAEKYHTGKRKGGQPELSHQIAICSYLRTIHKYFIDPVAVFVVALLHDTPEDYKESIPEIQKELPEYAPMTMTMSKVREGKGIPYPVYFGEMTVCPVCSIVKLADRIANVSTMIGVFSIEKQDRYLQDLIDWFFPMLKKAKRLFPEQEPAYENAKTFLHIIRDSIIKTREDTLQLVEQEEAAKEKNLKD